MTDAALNSDHVNYLVLRYLQEAGHANAARALHRDWHRTDQYKDPEHLPFAADVKHNQLVNLIQDGLTQDHLQSVVTKQSPRYNLINNTFAQRSLPHTTRQTVRKTSTLTNGQSSKPLSARSCGTVPGPKDTNGDNGDAMQLDHVSPGFVSRDSPSTAGQRDLASSDRDENLDDTDRTVAQPDSTPAVETIPASTQTDPVHHIPISTSYISLPDQLNATIMHASWCPIREKSSLLLVAGESVGRLFDIRTGQDSTSATPLTTRLDLLDAQDNAMITSACWHPQGRHFTSALRYGHDPDDETAVSTRILEYDANGDRAAIGRVVDGVYDHYVVLLVRYNSSGTARLIVSTNGVRGRLEMISTDKAQPMGTRTISRNFATVIMDAVWISDNQVAICGDKILSIATVDANDIITSDVTDTNDMSWDKVRYDEMNGVLVAACVSTDRPAFLHQQDSKWVPFDCSRLPDSVTHGVLALAYEPVTTISNNADTRSRLALAHKDGKVHILSLDTTSCELSQELSLENDQPVLAIAWSPTEPLIAAASDDSIRVWDLTKSSDPVIAWRAAPEYWYSSSDHHLPGDDDDEMSVPCLAWNCDGSVLAFALGRRVCFYMAQLETGY